MPGGSSASGTVKESAACNLVRCMLMRAAYGGMGGDVSMLRKFAAIWQSRSAPHTNKLCLMHCRCFDEPCTHALFMTWLIRTKVCIEEFVCGGQACFRRRWVYDLDR